MDSVTAAGTGEAGVNGSNAQRVTGRQWQTRGPAPVVPHPAPSVPGRPATAGELGRAPSALLRAVRAPWSATATYAKGTPLPARGREFGPEVESIVVRLQAPGRRAWAAWIGGKFSAAQVADKDGIRVLSAREVAAMVKGE